MFADWLRAYIPREMTDHQLEVTVTYPDEERSKRQKRTGDPHARRIRCVCRACNTGWMSRLQEESKAILEPILTGKATHLYKRQQTLIAAWIAMTVMVAEFIDRDSVAVDQEDRVRLKRRKRPPSHWRIWIARGQPPARPPLYYHRAVAFADSVPEQELERVKSEAPAPSNTQTSTVRFGKHLIVHVMSSSHRGARGSIRRWLLPPKLSPFIFQVWPIQSFRIDWPPERALTTAEIDIVAEDFFDAVRRLMRDQFGLI